MIQNKPGYRFLRLLIVLIFLSGFEQRLQAEDSFSHAVVATDHPLASQAGVEVVKKGGNVVDAAVASSFALSVVRPESCGIGGGGFMMIWNASNQKSYVIDYREVAPGLSKPDQFYTNGEKNEYQDSPSRTGHRSVAVPGTVAGLCYAVKHFGRLPLEEVIAPAIRLAEKGIKVDGFFMHVQKDLLKEFKQFPGYQLRFHSLWKDYLNSGSVWKTGDVFYSPQLKVLRLIQKEGAGGFYSGDVAANIVRESYKGGGLITENDLLNYKPVMRKSIKGSLNGFDVLGMPPPSSGGVTMIEIINIMNSWFKKNPGQDWDRYSMEDPESLQVLIEAMKYAYADRASYLGDPDFVNVPVQMMISSKHAKEIAAKIKIDKTESWEKYGSTIPVNDSGTSHISVMDASGNAVACTETINTHFGSYVVVPKYGIVLNNEMDDFTSQPGKPNAFGLIQSEANKIQPGKKPLSSMSPTILVKNGKAVYVAGASGGPKIISSTLQVILWMVLHQKSPEGAVGKPRLHHQWLPDQLFLEEKLYEKTAVLFKQKGHQVQQLSSIAAVQAVSRTAEDKSGQIQLSGASDPRKGGSPAGY